MMPTATTGLETELLAIKPQGVRSQGAEGAGQAFSNELKERMESRETQQESRAEERDGTEDDVAAAENKEIEERDEELSADDESRRGKGEEDSQERQESVAADEAEEEEGGKIMPFSLATLIPSDTQTVDAEEGEQLSVNANTPRSALAERLSLSRQPQAKVADGALSAQVGEAADPLLEGEAVPDTRSIKSTTTLQGALEGAAPTAGKGGAEAEVAALRQLAARSLEAPLTGRDALTPAVAASGAAAATAASAAAQNTLAATPTNLIQLPVQAPVQQPGWDRAMGERMVWMARNNVQEAQLQLNPRHLGPIEVRLSLNQDQAQVSFVAASPQAREALESSLPRLREMFAEQGLNLGQADVHSRGREQGNGERGAQGGGRGFSLGDSGVEEAPVVVHQAPLAPGRLDFYA